MTQKESEWLFVEDGWLYSLHEWIQATAEVHYIENDLSRRLICWTRLPKALTTAETIPHVL